MQARAEKSLLTPQSPATSEEGDQGDDDDSESEDDGEDEVEVNKAAVTSSLPGTPLERDEARAVFLMSLDYPSQTIPINMSN